MHWLPLCCATAAVVGGPCCCFVLALVQVDPLLCGMLHNTYTAHTPHRKC
jgi:hypothetical protein